MRIVMLGLMIGPSGCVRSPCPDGEGFTTYYRDRDGDGFGQLEGVQRCIQPEGYVRISGDCADRFADVNPDAADVCNRVDDDCDPSTPELGHVFVDGARLTPTQASERLRQDPESREFVLCGTTLPAGDLGRRQGDLVIRAGRTDIPSTLITANDDGAVVRGEAGRLELRDLTFSGAARLSGSTVELHNIVLSQANLPMTPYTSLHLDHPSLWVEGLSGVGDLGTTATAAVIDGVDLEGSLTARTPGIVLLRNVELRAAEWSPVSHTLAVGSESEPTPLWRFEDVGVTGGTVTLAGQGSWTRGTNTDARFDLVAHGDMVFDGVSWTGHRALGAHHIEAVGPDDLRISGIDADLAGGVAIEVTGAGPLALEDFFIGEGTGNLLLNTRERVSLIDGHLHGSSIEPALLTFDTPIVMDTVVVTGNAVDTLRYRGVLSLGQADVGFTGVVFDNNAPAAVEHRGVVWDVEGSVDGVCDADGCR